MLCSFNVCTTATFGNKEFYDDRSNSSHPSFVFTYVCVFSKSANVDAKEKDQSCQTVNKGWNADVASTLSSHAHSIQLFMKLFVIDSIPRLNKPIFNFSQGTLGY